MRETVAAWVGAVSGAGGTYFGPRATLRQSFRLGAGGKALRLRLSNFHAYSPLSIQHITVRICATPSRAASEFRSLTLGGRQHIDVAPGDAVWTDWEDLPTDLHDSLEVSVFIEEPVETVTHAWSNKQAMSSLTGSGDHTLDESEEAFRPFGNSWFWCDAAEVASSAPMKAIVALGDSITDGAGAMFDTDTRWTDFLSERMSALEEADPRRRSVINAGIGGNTLGSIGNAQVGVNVRARLHRDALCFPSVAEVLIFAGTNDIYVGRTSAEVISDLREVSDEIRAHGRSPWVATMIGRFGGYGWDDLKERRRDEVNQWIRTQSSFDQVLDFERALSDPDSTAPGIPHQWNADGTHPNSAGNRRLADAVPLDFFG